MSSFFFFCPTKKVHLCRWALGGSKMKAFRAPSYDVILDLEHKCSESADFSPSESTKHECFKLQSPSMSLFMTV